MFNNRFKDRSEAGLLLSDQLQKYKNSNSMVLAVPRGGVPVGYEIAKALSIPFHLILSKKIGHPENKEFAIGAVALETEIIDAHPGVSETYIQSEISRLRKLLKEKNSYYRGSQVSQDIKGKTIILVDDGIATGNTLLACIAMLRKQMPSKIVVAVPVVPVDLISIFSAHADEFIYLISAHYFLGVGAYYEQFNQVEDEEVVQFLQIANPVE